MPRKMKKNNDIPSEEPQPKRMKLLSDDEASDDDHHNDAANLRINKDFAKRFEHNKQREERQRLEEKYGKNGADEDDDDDSESSEEEDDAADLATAELDAEIFETLNAIKKKDPRVYDKESTFYTPFDPDNLEQHQAAKKEKPMYLKDYHQKNLLNGNLDPGAEEDAPIPTYAQEQQALKDELINQMHAAADNQEGEDNDDDDDFFTRKPKPVSEKAPQTSRPKITDVDIKTADKDPENFLSNFMASRAWVPEETSRFTAMDSDDSEDERRAEQFEAAYNWRFEDPTKANEKLMTFSRDATKLSVRREDKSGRKKLREKEREKKDHEKRERDEEKARLRKFRIDDVEEKVKKIKEAAGLKSETLDISEWKQVLNEDWDDNQWEQEMKRRFGANYYADAEAEAAAASDVEDAKAKKSKKPKKPSWDDDIDIKDLVPEFSDEEETTTVAVSENSDGEDEDVEMAEGEEDETAAPDGSSKPKSKKDRQRAQADKRRVARKERMAIEEMVDADLTTTLPSSGFRYRETSPTTFGLTTRDILFADDGALNTFAGLKKMATWRDEDKKKRDKKKLGKKARLRQWRKETFGDEEGFRGGFREFLGEEGAAEVGAAPEQGGSRKRRGKKRKAEDVAS